MPNKVEMFWAVQQDLIALAARVGYTLHSRGCPTLETATWIITDRGRVTQQFDPENLDNLIDLLELKFKQQHPGPN
jgi:hypothetical protein